MIEIKRKAEVGETIRVTSVSGHSIPLGTVTTVRRHNNNGYVIADYDTGREDFGLQDPTRNSGGRCLMHNQYVVQTEGYTLIERTAKVGDNVIVTSGGGHHLEVNTIFQVTHVDANGWINDGKGNCVRIDQYKVIEEDVPEKLEANPNFSETKMTFDELLNGSFEAARISASIAPKRSRSKAKAESSH